MISGMLSHQFGANSTFTLGHFNLCGSDIFRIQVGVFPYHMGTYARATAASFSDQSLWLSPQASWAELIAFPSEEAPHPFLA